jgi:hypothetical protein
MAKLNELAKSLNVELPNKLKIETPDGKSSGSKRRDWLAEDINKSLDNSGSKGVYEPLKQKGSINPVDQPLLKGVYEPLKQKGSINPVDQPLLKSEISKGVYRPLLITLEDLRGNPLRITQYLFELSKQEVGRVTGKVTQSEIMKMLNISKDSSKTGIRFLLKNELINRVDLKIGKSGWSKYKLKEQLFNELNQAYEKGSINPLSENRIQKGSNNSSSYINNTITTNRPLLDWDNIDIEPLANIGLTKKHLLQVKSKNAPDIVQESIYHFAYGIQFSEKTKKYEDPLSVLIGVLRKGEAWIESSYRSQQEIVLEKIIGQKKKQQERLVVLEEELIKSEFEGWHQDLTEEIKEELTKNLNSGSFSEPIQEIMKKAHLFQYFKSVVRGKGI